MALFVFSFAENLNKDIMFSAEYRNEAVVVNAVNLRRINFQNVEKLQESINQVLRNPCKKIILDLHGIKFIDSESFSSISELVQLTKRHNVNLVFSNIDQEVTELFELIPESANFKVEEIPTEFKSVKTEVFV